MRAVNLIPAEQREGAGGITGNSGGAALIVLGLIVGVAVLSLLYGSAKHKVSSRRSELTKIESELTTVRAEASRLTPYTSFISMADQRAKEISQLVASRFDWSHAFNELGRVLPRTATFTSFSGHVGGGSGGGGGAGAATSASSSTPPGSTTTFQLSGCATSQSEVADTLQRLRLMDGVTEVALGGSSRSARSQSSTAQSSTAQSSAAQSGGASACPTTFSATVTFAPLPATPTAPPAAAIVPMTVSSPATHSAPLRVTVSTKPKGAR